MARNRQ